MAKTSDEKKDQSWPPMPKPLPPAPAPVEPPAQPEILRPTTEMMVFLSSPEDPVLILAEVSGKQIEVDVEMATQALIERCHVDDEWNLRVCAERFEKMAARLRAEWLRRRGGQP